VSIPVEAIMITLRSAMMAGVIALSCVGISQPADAQRHGGFGGGRGGFDRGGFGGNRFFFGFGFGGYGFGGYPYYPYYPGYYYPPYYPYPYYPPYSAYPGAYPAAAPGGYPAAANPGATSAVDPATVREVQAELRRRGYNVGPVDGRLGRRTKTAIREYEQRNGLPADGSPSPSLRNHMQSHPTG
jgi:Putative peptidoglycan binding domain